MNTPSRPEAIRTSFGVAAPRLFWQRRFPRSRGHWFGRVPVALLPLLQLGQAVPKSAAGSRWRPHWASVLIPIGLTTLIRPLLGFGAARRVREKQVQWAHGTSDPESAASRGAPRTPGILARRAADLAPGTRPAAAPRRQLRRWVVVGRATSFDQMTDLPRVLREQLAERVRPARHDGGPPPLVQRRHAKAAVAAPRRATSSSASCCRSATGAPSASARRSAAAWAASSAPAASAASSATCRPREILEQTAARPQPAAGPRTADPHRRHGHGRAAGQPRRPAGGAGDGHAADRRARHRRPPRHHLHRRPAGQDPPPGRLGKQYHLAVSLHAPNDALRNRIVPTNDKIGLAAILDAADYFFETTGRQVTYEYVLLRDLNDRPAHAAELGRLLRGRQAHVNLIPFNDVEGLPYRRPTQEALDDFMAILQAVRRQRQGAQAQGGGHRRRLRPAARARPWPSLGARRNPFPPPGFNAAGGGTRPYPGRREAARGNDRRDQRATGPPRSGHPPDAAGARRRAGRLRGAGRAVTSTASSP